MAELGEQTAVHIIEDLEEEDIPPVSSSDYEEALPPSFEPPRNLLSLRGSVQSFQSQGANIVKREAAIINRRLLRVQKKKQMLSKAVIKGKPVSEKEEKSIWRQVERMQRLSVLLKNAQIAQQLFLQELEDES